MKPASSSFDTFVKKRAALKQKCGIRIIFRCTDKIKKSIPHFFFFVYLTLYLLGYFYIIIKYLYYINNKLIIYSYFLI